MYQNNHSQKKYFIKFLFVLCFSFLNSPAFSQPASTNLSIPNSQTGRNSSSIEESILHSVWEISNSFYRGTAFAIRPNQMITNFHVLSSLLENGGSLKDIFLYQFGSPYPIKIRKVIRVSVLYDLALFETEETVSNYLEFTKDFLDPKEKLSVVGYREGVLTIIQKTGNLLKMDSLSMFPANTMNFAAMSGSPVLNIKGEVVGVKYGGVSNLLLFTEVSDIQRFLSGQESTLCSSSHVKCFEQEIRNIKQKAEQGSALHQYILSSIYRDGSYVDFIRVSLELAFKLLKKAAEQGLVMAQADLAYTYSQGNGTEINKTLAVEWYKKSAKRGSPLSQINLADIYETGVGTVVPVNKYLAFEWYTKAADQGLAPAQYALGRMYMDGVETIVNKYLAFYLMQKSSKNGYEPAKKFLDVMSRGGFGTEIKKCFRTFI